MIIHGDCRYVLPTLTDSSIDLVLTDPPYGINYQNNATQDNKKIRIDSHGYSYSFLAKQSYRLLCSNSAFFAFTHWSQYSEHYIELEESGFTIKEPLIIQKNITRLGDIKGGFANNSEWCLFAHKGDFIFKETQLLKNKHAGKKRYQHFYATYKQRMPSCWFGEEYPSAVEHPTSVIAKQYPHPTIKNLEMISWLILLCTDEGDTVLDPYAGTCTVAVACEQLNRKYICIEKEASFVEMGRDRVSGKNEYKEDWKDLFMRM